MARDDTLLPHSLSTMAVLRLDDSALIPAAAFGGDRATAWERLFFDAAEPNPFAERWTVEPALRALGALAEVTIAWVTDSRGWPLGVLPLTRASAYGRLRVAHTTNWTHANAFSGTPIVRKGHEVAFWTRLLALLDESDWPGFLHLTGLPEDGPVFTALSTVADAQDRPLSVVHRTERALLASRLSADAYWTATVRKKKRKEVARLANRLAERGTVTHHRLARHEDAGRWVDRFLTLEAAGWKGRAGSALACDSATAAVFRATVAGAHERARLHALTLRLDGRPLAMLATLLSPPGAHQYKIAYDEAFARYSPGVLIEREALSLLGEPGVAWVDSCATAHHPMIDSLWAERRSVVRATVALAGRRRRAVHDLTRLAERGWTAARRLADRMP